jgi:hypothetical protein
MCKRPKLVTHYSNEWNCITVFALRQEVLKNLLVAGADAQLIWLLRVNRQGRPVASKTPRVSAYAFTNTAGDCALPQVVLRGNPHAC